MEARVRMTKAREIFARNRPPPVLDLRACSGLVPGKGPSGVKAGIRANCDNGAPEMQTRALERLWSPALVPVHASPALATIALDPAAAPASNDSPPTRMRQ